MLLQALREYSERLDLPPEMYQSTPIKWVIDLDGRGRLLGFVPTAGADAKGRGARGKEFLAPDVMRSVSIRPKLLADKADYVLGLAPEPARGDRARACHAAFVELVRACADQTREPSVSAVAAFLGALEGDAIDLPEDLAPGDTLTFRVDGGMPIDLATVRAWWAERARAVGRGREGTTAKCLVCGRQREPAERHPVKVKGLPGGQSSGTALVSANAEAFESYGQPASLVAPICMECAEHYGKAANALIQDDTTHLRAGGVVYVFWTREQQGDFSVATMLSDPDPQQVRSLIESALSGSAPPDTDASQFYASALTASGGRVVVRDWIDTTVGEAKRRLAGYFVSQRIVGADGLEGRPLKLMALAGATVRDLADLAPDTVRVLLRFALHGGVLPQSLLAQAVRRMRAEAGRGERGTGHVTRPRAALIKMVLASRSPEMTKEGWMESLDRASADPAYLSGRLLAVLEAVQRAALPGAKATIVDRFFGSASTSPLAVFPRLIRGAQPHLAKLRRDKRGAYVRLQERLEEVQVGLSNYPALLTLEQQGMFALGYYHERAAERARFAERRAEAREEEQE